MVEPLGAPVPKTVAFFSEDEEANDEGIDSQQPRSENGNASTQSDNASTDVLAASESRIPVPNMRMLPKKGILKRSTSFGSEKKSRMDRENADTVFPLRNDRHSQSPPSVAANKSSKIPRLSVTWWETNSICEDSPKTTRKRLKEGPVRTEQSSDDDYDTVAPDDDEELQSCTSSHGSSQIAGTWWFGRTTKFVPHCERRHMHGHGGDHGHGSDGEYLTPTQRKNREVVEMKKVLQRALSQLDDKERHLSQLRLRLDELERMMDSSTEFSDIARLMARQRNMTEDFEKEKKALIDKYEANVKQLRQEAIDSRAEAVRSKLEMQQCLASRAESRHWLIDAQTLTEPIDFDDQYNGEDIQSYRHICEELRNKLKEMVETGRQHEETVERLNGEIEAFVCQRQDMVTKLQAHEKEELAWRTKAVELELVLKRQLMLNEPLLYSGNGTPCSPANGDFNLDTERYRQECIRLQTYVNQLESEIASNKEMIDSGIEASASLTAECIMAQCVAKRKQLSDDNCQLMEQISEQTDRLTLFEKEMAELRQDDHKLDAKLRLIETRLSDAADQLRKKVAECEAAQMGVQRFQSDNDILRKAVAYLEDRCQTFQNVILDNGFVVKGETTSDWRHGCSDPGTRLDRSVRTQTQLTSDQISSNQHHFSHLSDQMLHLEERISIERFDLHEKFLEFQENAQLKTELVESLSRQLKEVNEKMGEMSEVFETERQEAARHLAQMAKIAQRVPILEAELEKTEKERFAAERKLAVERNRFEEALETALSESMKQQQDQSSYWRQKMDIAERVKKTDRDQLKQLQRTHKELKLRLNLEKVDLEQKLEGTISQVASLTDRVYRPMDDKESLALPEVINKYVACRPILKDKITDIEKGDLFDETEERLKLAQGELLTTRRQVEVLQQKLLDYVEEKEEQKGDENIVKKVQLLEVELSVERKSSDDRIKSLQSQKDRLETRLRQCEEDKAGIVRAERERIAQLVTEFDNVRQELDEEIRKYEVHKCSMKERIGRLETLNREQKIRLRRFEHLEHLLTAGPVQHLPDVATVENELRSLLTAAHTRTDGGTDCDFGVDPPKRSFCKEPGVQFLLSRLKSERQKYSDDVDLLRGCLAQAKEECARLTAVLAERRPSTISSSGENQPTEGSLLRTLSDPVLCISQETTEKSKATNEDTKARLRTKNLMLIKNNQKLTSELSQVRQKLETSINRTISRRSTMCSVGGDGASIRVERSPGFADLASDLNEVRLELEGILQHIDATAVHQQSSNVPNDQLHQQLSVQSGVEMRHGRLVNWLDKEIKEDKKELDSMTKWYERDRDRMATNLKVLRDDRASLQAQLDRLAVDYNDVCRELELYKREDEERAKRSLGMVAFVAANGRLVRSVSLTDINGRMIVDRLEHVRWKEKAGSMFTEMSRLRRELNVAIEGRRDADRSLNAQLHSSHLTTQLEQPSSLDKTSTLGYVEKDLKMEVDRLEKQSRNMEMASNRLKEQLDSALRLGQVSKAESNAKTVQIRALEMEVAALARRRLSMPVRSSLAERSPSADQCPVSSEKRQRRSRSFSQCTETDKAAPTECLQKAVSSATFVTTTESSFGSLCKGTAVSDGADSYMTASSPNLAVYPCAAEEQPFSSPHPSIIQKLLIAEDRADRVEKEYEMAQTELAVLRDATRLQLSNLRAERSELKKRLHEVIMDAEKTNPTYSEGMDELVKECNRLKEEVARMTGDRQDMYLVMFRKGQEAARHEIATSEHRSGDTYTQPLNTDTLHKQLAATNSQGLTDDQVVLRFLRDAVYYFLMNRDPKDHLQTIMALLKFSEKQAEDVQRRRSGSH